eukprot:746676-Hanusia_phi.AAC.8
MLMDTGKDNPTSSLIQESPKHEHSSSTLRVKRVPFKRKCNKPRFLIALSRICANESDNARV